MRYNFTNGSRRNGVRRRAPREEPDIFVRVRASERRGSLLQRWGAWLLALLVLAGIVVMIGMVARAVRQALFVQNSRYRLRVIDARSDGRLTADQIVEFAGLVGVSNLFEVNLRKAHELLLRLPSVRSVSVRRRLPDTIEVRVAERSPLARVALAQAGYTDAVDREGVLLGPKFAAERLPLIVGLNETGLLRPGQRLSSGAALAALTVLDLCETTRVFQSLRIRRVDVSPTDYLIVELDNGDHALLPHTQIASKLRRLVTILTTIQNQRLPRGPEPLEIDLTTEEVFPVRGLRVETPNGTRM